MFLILNIKNKAILIYQNTLYKYHEDFLIKKLKRIKSSTKKKRRNFMTPKLEITKQVLEFVKSIAKNDGGDDKKAIDTKKGYNELCNLLSGNVIQMTETDKEYCMGLKVQYEERYFGNSKLKNKVQDSKPDNTNPAPQQKNDKGHTEKAGEKSAEKTKTYKQSEAHKEKPVSQNNRQAGHVPARPQKSKSNEKTKGVTKNNQNVHNKNGNQNSGIIVDGDNNQVSITNNYGTMPSGAKATSEAAKSSSVAVKSPNVKKEEILKESKFNYNEAFADGEQVADDLIGYTSTKEKNNAIRNVMKQSEATIMGFISGFNNNDTVLDIPYGKGGLLDQIDNENGWTDSEKLECFKRIVNTTLSWAEKAGYNKDGNFSQLKQIAKDLAAGNKIDTERADLLITELVSRGKAEARI